MENYKTSEITKIDIGILDAKSKCRFTNYKSRNPGGGTRGTITKLSRQSRSRLLYSARNIGNLTTLITFTYPHGDYAKSATGGDFMHDGLVVKDHLRKVRQLLTYRNCYGFWFLEFQKRGAPHFHFFIAGSIPLDELSKIKKTWYRMVGSDCPHHLTRGIDCQALKKQHAAGSYAAKYSTKDEQKTVPERYKNVGRFWGLFGDIPEKRTGVSVSSLKELYRMARIARNWSKNEARTKGYKLKRRTGHGLTGTSLYNCGPVLRQYIERTYSPAPRSSSIAFHTSTHINISHYKPIDTT